MPFFALSTTITKRNEPSNNNSQSCHRRCRQQFSHCPIIILFLSLITTFYSSSSVVNGLMFVVPDPIIHFSVGAVAGGAGAVAAYPFDYIKSQMQTEYGRETYDNGLEAFFTTVQKNPLQLYKGVGVQVLGIAPEKGIKLGVNDLLQATSMSSLGSFPLWAQIVSGGISGACQVIASSPLEVMKVGLQTSDMSIQEVWTKVGGASGLFRGAEACILRDVLFTAICFPLYSALVHGDAALPAFVAGAISGVVSSFAATPPDVIKTRILSQDQWSSRPQKSLVTTTQQTASLVGVVPTNGTATLAFQDAAAMAATTTSSSSFVIAQQQQLQPQQQASGSTTTNPFQVAQSIIEREGIAVLFSGVTERCIGAIPRFGTTLAMHDVLEQMISQAGWLSHSIS